MPRNKDIRQLYIDFKTIIKPFNNIIGFLKYA